LKHWIEVAGTRLAENFAALQSVAGADATLLAVVKANAYGHGAAVCAPILAQKGARWLGVTDATEGVAVRAALVQAGITRADQPRILVMSGLAEDEAGLAVEHELTAVVWSVEQMEWLRDAAQVLGRRVLVHVEVDTGMARQGAAPGAELEKVLGFFALSAWVELDGVLTHYAAAEVAGSAETAAQQARFEIALEQVRNAGLKPEWVHAGNSSTVDEGGTIEWLRLLALDMNAKAMVRPGLALYGYSLPVEGDATPLVRPKLKPVMQWKAKVIGMRAVEAGAKVGYSGTFIAKKAMRLALLPVGYADGLRRELSSGDAGGWVMFGAKRAAIVGRISMNLTVVDVTEIDGVALGDLAVVLGDGITAEDHARMAGTIPYDIVCGVRAETVMEAAS
jgi:alanine racemase